MTKAGHNIAVIADLTEAAAGPRAAAAPNSRGAADAMVAARAAFPDWKFAPNIGGHPDVYELENRAVDSAGHVLAAMHALAPWDGRTLVDLGCGAGFWLSRYAGGARTGAGSVSGAPTVPATSPAQRRHHAGAPATGHRPGQHRHHLPASTACRPRRRGGRGPGDRHRA